MSFSKGEGVIDNVREITFCPTAEGADRGWYVFFIPAIDGWISVKNVSMATMDVAIEIDELYGEDGGDIKISFPYPMKITLREMHNERSFGTAIIDYSDSVKKEIEEGA